MKIRLFPIAQKELDAAIEYYNSQRQGLGYEFLSETVEALERIKKFPLAWSPFTNETRRCLITRFPYGIIYLIKEENIFVAAIANLHREPDYWIDRI
jgi:hypothetical protein